MDAETLLMPFRFGFMQNAFLISAIVSVPTALLSCFLVLKGWALMGDAVSHAVLPGIVLAHVLGVPLLGHRLSLRDILAVVMGYSGVLIIATRGRVLDLDFTSPEGVVYALVSTLVWALYWLVSTRDGRDPVVCLCLNFLFALPLAFGLCAVFSDLCLPGWKGLGGAAYIGLFDMGVTFALWSTALSLSCGVSRIGNLIFLSPLVSLLFIATVLGEDIHPATLVGLGLIIPGVLLQQQGRRAPEAVAE